MIVQPNPINNVEQQNHTEKTDSEKQTLETKNRKQIFILFTCSLLHGWS